MSIIVTGASGQLGRLVIEELLTSVPAAEVTAVVRDPAKAGIDACIAAGELSAVPGDLSRLAGRPTTPVADAIAAALAG